jgi:glycerophosphoryl diester phosphodiesterase
VNHLRTHTKLWVVPFVSLLVVASCGSNKKEAASSTGANETVTSPVTEVPVTKAAPKEVGGGVIDAKGPELVAGLKRWQITFTTQLRDGSQAESTGLVYLPDRDAPAGGWPVASYAHATVGVADKCAPSANPGLAEGIVASLFADQNMAVVMSDYPGLGTPGDNFFLDGPSAGNSVLDIARAAAKIDGVSLSNRTVLIGHSQGGHAALFAAENAKTHAPDLNIVAVVAGAPPSQLNSFVGRVANSKRRGYSALVAKGLSEVNTDLKLAEVLTPEGLEVAKSFDAECSDQIIDAASTSKLLKSDSLPQEWKVALDANEPGTRPIAAPLLLFHGDQDELIPFESSAVLMEKYKKLGTSVERKAYPGADHTSVILLALGDISQWVGNIVNPVEAADTAAAGASEALFPGATGALRSVLEKGQQRPLVIAHAGGEQEAPHSTPYAFAQSVANGADVLELDVRLTKDKKLVVFHDPDVDRTTNETGPVADRTLAQMQALDAAHNFAPGCWDCRNLGKPFSLRGVRLGTTPPPKGYVADDFGATSLDSLLVKYPDMVFDIEIKTDGPDGGLEAAAALATRLLADPKPDRFIVVSFDDAALAAFRKDAPSIPTSPGFGEITSYVLADKKLSPTPVVQIPPEAQGLELFNDAFRAKAKRDGIAIWVWPSDYDTDTAENYRKILEGMPNGIIAGRPSELAPLLGAA